MATVYRLKKARIIGLICSLLTTLFILWIWSSMDTSPIFSSDRRMKLDHLLVPRGDNLLSATISQRAIRSYDESIQKDRDLMCAMEQPRDADPAFVEQSSWTSLADLPKYGWNVRVNPGIQGIFGLEAAFSDLGISSSEAEWRTINLGHNTQTTEGSTIYPATFAQFLTLLNGKTPTLIAKMSYGPAYKASQMHISIGGNRQLPPLQRWSDLIYLSWKRITTYPDGSADQRLPDLRTKLEHVFRYQVSNDDTRAIIRRAHGGGTIASPNEMPPAWPGWEFTPVSNGDAFKSILSALNLFGVAYLLASHKEDDGFKVKTIDRINAFNCPFALPGRAPEARFCVYLHLAPV